METHRVYPQWVVHVAPLPTYHSGESASNDLDEPSSGKDSYSYVMPQVLSPGSYYIILTDIISLF